MRTGSLLAAVVALTALAWCGCFRKMQDQAMPDSVSCVTFEGTEVAVSLFVDGAAIASDVPLEPSNGVRYQVTPGRHTIEVVRGGKAVVKRQVYVGDGETFVVSVPGN